MNNLCLFARLDNADTIPLTATKHNGYTRFSLCGDLFKNATTVCIESESFSMNAKDKGYYLVPGETNSAGSAKIGFKKLENNEKMTIYYPTLNYYADRKSVV